MNSLVLLFLLVAVATGCQVKVGLDSNNFNRQKCKNGWLSSDYPWRFCEEGTCNKGDTKENSKGDQGSVCECGNTDTWWCVHIMTIG